MKILLIGPQGSGKSTQADLLAQFLNVPKISTGDIFREIAKEDSEEGKRIKQIIESGQLVDDDTTRSLVKRRLGRPDCQDGFVIEGYPRNSEQAELFTGYDFKPDKAFYVKVPEEEVSKRLTQRGRKDDTPEIIKVRLENYNNKIASLLEFLRSLGILVEIDGTGSIAEVQDQIRKHLQ